VKCRRAITVDTTLPLARYFAWHTQVWIYERQMAEAEMRLVLKRIKPCAQAAA